MMRDPLYTAICEALEKPLDGNLFQACAVSRLMLSHTNLAPMPGGDDEGMDGAFGTPDGPFPLICTTQANVIGNFRKNLQRYLTKYPNGPKRAVVATSRALSNKKKRNLHTAASDLGVTLANIYEAEYFREQLYQDAQWRKTLLGITGRPSALSKFPKTIRHFDSGLLVGRDEVLSWLESINSDALIVGQPGSGKTYLHQHLASEGSCYFAVDSAPEALADAIREKRPSIIVVDDAHLNLDLLQELKNLRLQIKADYKIHANCWPSHAQEVMRALGISRLEAKTLKRLKREEVYDLVQALGIKRPDWLLNLIIEQADGKPGLAYAMTKAALESDIQEVLFGDVLNRELLNNPNVVRNFKEKFVLALFALGGNQGISADLVSSISGIPFVELAEITACLGTGGIVEEVSPAILRVFPEALRGLLVREVFYRGTTTLRLDRMLEKLPRTPATNSVLLHAKQLGADIDDDYLENAVRQCATIENWEHFAYTGPKNSLKILQKFPEVICETASALLRYHPMEALDKLLDFIESGTNHKDGDVAHPKRKIHEWIIARDDNQLPTIERRKYLLSVIENKIRKNQIGTGRALIWGLSQILGLSFEEAVLSARSKREIQFTSGVMSSAVIEDIAALWPKVFELFQFIPALQAPVLLKALENWILPQRLSSRVKLPHKTYALLRRQASKMLADVLSMKNANRAWKSWALSHVQWSKLKMRIPTDSDYEAIFGERHELDWQAEQKKRKIQLDALAQRLLSEPIADAISFIQQMHDEALGFERNAHQGHLNELYDSIATKTSMKNEWLEALIQRRALTSHISPFLHYISIESPDVYEAHLWRLLEIDIYQEHAIRRIVRLHPCNEALLDKAMSIIGKESVINTLRLYDPDISSTVMARMLTHETPEVRAMAVSCEWNCDPKETVRPELETIWKSSVPDVSRQSHDLSEIFQKYPDLAFQWLRRKLQHSYHWLSKHDMSVHQACKMLTHEQKQLLIRELTNETYSDEIFDLLIGNDFSLFREWLDSHKDLEEYQRLKPLHRKINQRWSEMALVALNAGVSVQSLQEISYPDPWFIDTPRLQAFQQLVPVYEQLVEHADLRIREVGRHGLHIIQEKIHQIEAKEQEF